MTATAPPPALLLDVRQVSQLLGISPRSLWRMADAGSFPRPLRVGAKLRRWPRSAVESWLADQSAEQTRRR